jgi:hypothetical protein
MKRTRSETSTSLLSEGLGGGDGWVGEAVSPETNRSHGDRDRNLCQGERSELPEGGRGGTWYLETMAQHSLWPLAWATSPGLCPDWKW